MDVMTREEIDSFLDERPVGRMGCHDAGVTYVVPLIYARDGDALYVLTTDGEKIRDAMTATDIPGEQTIMPWKRVKFDDMGQNNDADPVLLQYVGGKLVTIFPSQAAVAEAIWPMK